MGSSWSLAEGSRYLWSRPVPDPERLVSLLQTKPARRFDDVLTDATRAIAAADDELKLCVPFAHESEAALSIALADIGGIGR